MLAQAFAEEPENIMRWRLFLWLMSRSIPALDVIPVLAELVMPVHKKMI